MLCVKNVQLEQNNTLKPLQFENKLVSLQRGFRVVTHIEPTKIYMNTIVLEKYKCPIRNSMCVTLIFYGWGITFVLPLDC